METILKEEAKEKSVYKFITACITSQRRKKGDFYETKNYCFFS